jgi:hypothetical protein
MLVLLKSGISMKVPAVRKLTTVAAARAVDKIIRKGLVGAKVTVS